MDFRPWREQETAAMLSICEQEEVMRYIDGPWSIERVRGFIEEEQARLVHEGVCRWAVWQKTCLLYTSPSPRDGLLSRMPSSA